MKIKFLIGRSTLFIYSLLIVTACSSGVVSLMKGAYFNAVIESISRLDENPEYRKPARVLRKSYPLAVDSIEENIQEIINSDDPRKWRKVVAGYEALNFMSHQIERSPAATEIIPKPQTRLEELSKAKLPAAEEAYQAGLLEMLKETRAGCKQAYYDFKDANGFVGDYKDAVEKMKVAKAKATIHIVYEEIDESTINYGGFTFIIKDLEGLFIEFNRIHSNDTSSSEQNLKFIFKKFQSDSTTISIPKDISSNVYGFSTRGALDGTRRTSSQEASGTFTRYTKKINLQSELTLKITEVGSNKLLLNETIHGHCLWKCDWATYSGDKRALSSVDQVYLNKREDFPSKYSLNTLLAEDLRKKTIQKLKDFYRQYY